MSCQKCGRGKASWFMIANTLLVKLCKKCVAGASEDYLLEPVGLPGESTKLITGTVLGRGDAMTFREALEKLKIIGQGWGEDVAISYTVSVDGAKPDSEHTSIFMHVGGKCVAVQSYEAGFAEFAKLGKVEDQEPDKEAAHDPQIDS